MRLTEFWRRMTEHFGSAHYEAFAQDHVLTELGNRTVKEALDQGVSAKEVWRVVCEAMEVPARLR